jgi:hypothetical protein
MSSIPPPQVRVKTSGNFRVDLKTLLDLQKTYSVASEMPLPPHTHLLVFLLMLDYVTPGVL